jgi:hypothetical protein
MFKINIGKNIPIKNYKYIENKNFNILDGNIKN